MYHMIIDIIFIVAAIIAVISGWRRGFIVQLCQLVALYAAILLAPDFASDLGHRFTADPGIAYIAGFAIIIVAAWLIIWIIAPLLRKILFWDFLRNIDSLLGMALAIIAFVVVTSVGCSIFSTANIGDVRTEKVLELAASGLSEDQIEEYAERLENKDHRMRDCFDARYVDFETLDESILFNPFVSLGDALCPELEEFKEEMVEWVLSIASANESR